MNKPIYWIQRRCANQKIDDGILVCVIDEGFFCGWVMNEGECPEFKSVGLEAKK